jgi:protein arginine N-methyltransferase 1
MAVHSDGDPQHGSYLDVDTHKDMLRDVVRTSAYAEAIRGVVKPGDRVIDFGSGTGVLAIFAARSGATVDAIERTQMVEHAREIARRSGCPNIRFHHADQTSFRGDAKVDVIVSEWMGHAVFYESMLEPLIQLRERWLRPGGLMLPSRLSIGCSLLTDEALYEDFSFLEHSPYGIDFGPIADLPLRQTHLVTLDEGQVTSAACELASLDMASILATPREMAGRLELDAPATAYGLVLWFEAELAPGVSLGTGPHHPPTHWRQLFMPFPQPRDVSPARPLRITVRPPRDVEAGEQTWAWSVDDGLGAVHVDERDSFSRAGRL